MTAKKEEGDDVVFFDGRNGFEAQIGKFKDAVVPDVATTHDFIKELDSGKYDALKDKPVVTYCTGGIRCEVLSSLMVNRGFKEVYQLDGGIVRYGETFKDQGLWEGSLLRVRQADASGVQRGRQDDWRMRPLLRPYEQVRKLLQSELPDTHALLRRVRRQPGNPAVPGRLRCRLTGARRRSISGSPDRRKLAAARPLTWMDSTVGADSWTTLTRDVPQRRLRSTSGSFASRTVKETRPRLLHASVRE